MNYNSAASPTNYNPEQFRTDIEAQDQKLDAIHSGVVGLKNQATAINHEVIDQNVLIDDVQTEMREGTEELRNESNKAKHIYKRKKQICFLYVVIVILIIAIILINSIG